MLTRLRLLKGANALLYMGPLLSGMSGHGWWMVPPFVFVFVLWLMLLRPEQWPATSAEWLAPQAWGAVFTQVLSQVLLVVVLLAVGRGLSGLAGFLPVLHPLLTLGLSGLSIPLSRYLWDAREAAQQGVFLDDEAELAQVPHAADEAAGAVSPLLALGETAGESDIRRAIEDLLTGPAAGQRLDALIAALGKATRSHDALRRSLVIWATEPEIVAPGQFPRAVDSAFSLSNRDPDLLRLFLPRALALASAFPDRVSGFPSASALRQAAADDLDTGPNSDLPADLRADLRDGLAALAKAVEAAQSKKRPVEELARNDAEPETAPRPA